ncbi:VOC family protein [Agrococcus terreus]|nr:VOC family protein [Agrococcus terreus]
MATSTIHLNFRGDARAALDHYRDVFGGEVAAFTYGQAQDPRNPDTEQIVFGELRGARGVHVMAYDVPPSMPFERGTNAMFVSVRSADAEEIAGYWGRLASSGEVVVELGPSGWSPLYGMVADRFGIVWVLDVVSGA